MIYNDEVAAIRAVTKQLSNNFQSVLNEYPLIRSHAFVPLIQREIVEIDRIAERMQSARI